MLWTVNLTITTNDPLTIEQLEAVAELTGAADGTPGDRTLGTTITVDAPDMPAAAATALEWVRDLAPGDPVALEVLTVDEADRRLTEPAFPELGGVSEVARLLGVSRQRASKLQGHRDFPAPVARLTTGPVWRMADLTRFAAEWERRPGRPAKAAS